MTVDTPSARAAHLLAAYDAQLRADSETPSAIDVTRLGALRLVTFAGGRGFVTCRNLDGLSRADVRSIVPEALSHFRKDPAIITVEWKTRGHDHAPGLHETLVEHGFIPGEQEAIMIGDAAALAVDVTLPLGVALRRLSSHDDVRAMSAMQDVAFGDAISESAADAVIARLARGDGMQLWVAEADGAILSAGRLEPVPGSDFAGIWGGATMPAWRGRGIYRALTSARAREALAMGKTLIHSDSTAFSRPILERSGLIAVSTTTPYIWSR